MKLFSALAVTFLLASATLAAPAHKPVKAPAPAAPSLPALPVEPLPLTPSTTPTVSAPPSASDDVTFYDGQTASDAGLSLAGWGAGAAAESTTISLGGGHSLLVTTLDPYQGAVLTFAKPADVNVPDPDKNRTLLLVLRPASVTRLYLTPAPVAPSPSPNSPPPGFPGGPPPGFPGGPPPGFPGGPPPGQGGYVPGAASPAARFAVWNGGQTSSFHLAQYGGGGGVSSLSALRTLHLIFSFTGGKKVDVLRPFPLTASGDPDEWVTMGVPIAALHLPDGPALLQSLTIAGDDYGSFYVGQIKLVRDTAPLSCFAGDQQTVAPDQAVTLHATASGGLSTLQYSWDFDDSDGITAQAEGQTVTTYYPVSGKDYKVTLTVSDRDGLKKPAVATTVVHVR